MSSLSLDADGKTAMVMTAAYLGFGAIALHLAAHVAGLPDFVRGFSIGLALVSLAALLVRKLRDEYVDRLWRAGASAAFVVTVLLFLARPFLVEGAFTGLGSAGFADSYDSLAAPFAILAFFGGFHAARLPGRR